MGDTAPRTHGMGAWGFILTFTGDKQTLQSHLALSWTDTPSNALSPSAWAAARQPSVPTSDSDLQLGRTRDSSTCEVSTSDAVNREVFVCVEE